MIRKIRSRVVELIHNAYEAVEVLRLERLLRTHFAGGTAALLMQKGTTHSAEFEHRLTQALGRIGVAVSSKDTPALYRAIEQHLDIPYADAKRMPIQETDMPIEALQVLEDWNALHEDLRIVHRGTYNSSNEPVVPTFDDVSGFHVPISANILCFLREQPFSISCHRYSSRPGTQWSVHVAGPDEKAAQTFLATLQARTIEVLRKRCQGKALDAQLRPIALKTCTRDELIYPPALGHAIDELLATFHGWCVSPTIRRWGYILIGPRGTGKTTIGGLLATERPADCTFLYCPAGEIASASDITRLFASARMFAPAIVQIDDVDLITPDRRGGDKKLTSALMEQLDGLREDDRVFTLFTTNDPEGMDDAVINRAGRVSGKIVFSGFEGCLAPLIRRYAVEYQIRVDDHDVETAAAASAPKVAGITPDEVKNVCQRLSLLHGTGRAISAEELAETIVRVFTMFHDPKYQESQLSLPKSGNGAEDTGGPRYYDDM